MNHFRTMNAEQAGSVVRGVVNILGGFVMMYGIMTDAQWQTAAAALVSLLMTFWGVWAKTDTNLVKSALDVPAVTNVTVASSDAALPILERKLAAPQRRKLTSEF